MSTVSSLFFTRFLHRRKADATFSSVCGLCLETVATAPDEEALEMDELAHRCPRLDYGQAS
jgi:hypothetical protein